MSTIDFLRLPPGAKTLFLVMLWPAIWAGTLMIIALSSDAARQMKKRTSRVWRKVA